MDAAVALALQQSPALEVARRERNVALIGSDRSRPAFRPEVNATASQTLRSPRVDLPGHPDDVVLPGSMSRFEIGLKQPLLQFGVGKAPEQRANAMAAAARSGFRKAELDTARDVQEAFLLARRAGLMLEVAEQSVTLARAHVELTRLLKERGFQAEVDLLEAERAEAEADSHRLQAQNGFALARANLNRLMGRAVDTPFSLGKVGELPPEPSALSDLVERARALRPELATVRHNIEAAEAGIKLARAARLPRVSLEAGYALQTETVLAPRSGIFGGLTITAPLFNSSVQRFTVREAEERLGQLRGVLSEAEQGIALEIEQQRLAMQEGRTRALLSERGIAAAEKAYEITRAKLERGLGTQLEVQNARLSLERALADRAEAEHALRLAYVRLQRAIGETIPPDAP
jgi:outer membrane protein TolC